MNLKLFTLRYDAERGGFDDRSMEAFLDGKDVFLLLDHFFVVNEVPHLACLVLWEPAEAPTAQEPPEGGAGGAAGGAGRHTDELLDPGDQQVFEAMRRWRAARARQRGVPPYRILTNRQLRAVVRARPSDAGALGQVAGVGPATVERWGAEVLAELGKREACAPGTLVETGAPGSQGVAAAPSEPGS